MATVALMSQMGSLTAAAAADPSDADGTPLPTVPVAPQVHIAAPPTTTAYSPTDEGEPVGLPMVVATGPPPAEFGPGTVLPGRPRRGAAAAVEEPAWAMSLTTTTTTPPPTPTAAPSPRPAPAPSPPATSPPPPPPPPRTEASG